MMCPNLLVAPFNPVKWRSIGTGGGILFVPSHSAKGQKRDFGYLIPFVSTLSWVDLSNMI